MKNALVVLVLLLSACTVWDVYPTGGRTSKQPTDPKVVYTKQACVERLATYRVATPLPTPLHPGTRYPVTLVEVAPAVVCIDGQPFTVQARGPEIWGDVITPEVRP